MSHRKLWHSCVCKQARAHSSLSHTLYNIIIYIIFLGRSSIRLLHGGTNTESTNREDQQGPNQNHDADDGGAGGNKHLRRGIYIRLYYILYGCQVMNDGATLPLLIQPARVADSPDDVDQLECLPPWLQIDRLRGDAALPVLLEGVNSGLPVP